MRVEKRRNLSPLLFICRKKICSGIIFSAAFEKFYNKQNVAVRHFFPVTAALSDAELYLTYDDTAFFFTRVVPARVSIQYYSIQTALKL